MKKCQEILDILLNNTQSLDWIAQELKQIPWDCDEPPVILSGDHIINILKRYQVGELTSQEIELWANLIENREDIDFEETNQKILEESIYRLANPILEGELSIEIAQEIINQAS